MHSRKLHTPVLLTEVLHYLNPHPGRNYIDATADGGGHAIAIIKAIRPSGRLLALEWDEELFEKLKERLKAECPGSSKNCVLRRTSYTELDKVARSSGFVPAAGILFDLGLSSFHLEASRRGFSFQKDEFLDMRYSRSGGETAADILNRASEEEIRNIISSFGEERFAAAIAGGVIRARKEKSITRTGELVEIIRRSTPRWYQRQRIHFATKTFQALRIAVNHELENVARGLNNARKVVRRRGRIAIISFHSLEDRIVKNFFRSPELKSEFRPVTPKPIWPGREETAFNPRSRSARLRVFEKV
ncbi:MAG: 16S rRNA (cytosine(1402)-N(4))-methyltransferase RsmH [Candidatus Sungbacteria bacterium]|nr:16S rRNA (cytosine(1402)-N(4))-methyltransferase RsmH [Candidatus Sungbacteria bacterium]